jgi:hypothetical protein
MCARQVLWYLVSDSLALRRAAKDKYGDTVFARTEDLELRHTSKAAVANGGGAAAMVTTVGESWAFGMTDVQALSVRPRNSDKPTFWHRCTGRTLGCSNGWPMLS